MVAVNIKVLKKVFKQARVIIYNWKLSLTGNKVDVAKVCNQDASTVQ
jgi:hypothetical protein